MKIQPYKSLNFIFIAIIVIIFTSLVYVINLNIKKQNIINTLNKSNTQTDQTNDVYTRIDTILKNYNFNYIRTYEKFSTIYLSVAEYNENNFFTNEYKINDGDSINVNIKSNDSFLITLPGNGTWTLNDSNSLKNISLDHTSSIIDWKNERPDDETGIILYHRDNFYFSIKSTGTETLQFKYPDGFAVNINITIS